jgi:hypothetical protein
MGILKKILFNQTFRFVVWYMTGTVIIVLLAAWLADVTLKIPYFDFTRELK